MRSSPTLLAVFALAISGCGEAMMDAVGLSSGTLPEGLVAHWRLDEGTGTIAGDGSGNGHQGQLSGGGSIIDGRFGGGVRFSAGNALVVPGFPAPTPNWSISLWLRFSNEQLAANRETWIAILSTENIGAAGWVVNLDQRLPQPRLSFSYWAPPLKDYVGVECACVETGAWLHLTAVVDAEANRIALYRSGTVANQTDRPSEILPGDSTLHFGHWNMGGRLLNGDLDDVAIWRRALTAAEVATLATRSPD